MVDENNDQVFQELEQLKQDYFESLQQELDDLLILTQVEEKEPFDRIDELMMACHRLAGTTITFGYIQLGAALSALEQYLKYSIDNNELSVEYIQEKVLELNNFMRDEAPNLVDVCIADTLDEELLDQESHTSDDDDTDNQQAIQSVKSITPANAQSVNIQTNDESENCLPVIYILEDDESAAELLRLQLTSFDYDVRTFCNGEALRGGIKEFVPDVLIVDIDLSDEVHGMEFVSELLKSVDKVIHLIVVSSQQSFEDKLFSVRQGVVAFFDKPVDVAGLKDRLARLLPKTEVVPFNIILVDDDEQLLKKYRRLLEKAGCQITTISEPTEIIKTIEQFTPDIMIFDLHMPTCSGIELAKLVRLHNHWAHIPIIYLSIEESWKTQLGALLSGGDEFLSKSISDRDFIAIVKSRARRARNIAQLVVEDSLTGLLKHNEIKERLARELALAIRSKTKITTAMVDIDHFKSVNDNYGHQTGDKVISTLAELLEQGLRSTDSVGRYGGEEFLLVLPLCDQNEAMVKLEKLREDFSHIPFFKNGQEFFCQFSAGVAVSNENINTDSLIERADIALYQAKNEGRNQVRCYLPPEIDEDN